MGFGNNCGCGVILPRRDMIAYNLLDPADPNFYAACARCYGDVTDSEDDIVSTSGAETIRNGSPITDGDATADYARAHHVRPHR